jgi:hypothetical protein
LRHTPVNFIVFSAGFGHNINTAAARRLSRARLHARLGAQCRSRSVFPHARAQLGRAPVPSASSLVRSRARVQVPKRTVFICTTMRRRDNSSPEQTRALSFIASESILPRLPINCLRKHHFNVRRVRRSVIGPVAQWIRHRPTEPGIAGSSPAGVIFRNCLLHGSECVCANTSVRAKIAFARQGSSLTSVSHTRPCMRRACPMHACAQTPAYNRAALPCTPVRTRVLASARYSHARLQAEIRTRAHISSGANFFCTFATRADNHTLGECRWRRKQADAKKATITQGTSGLVAMTSASHAEGRQFDPGLVYLLRLLAEGVCVRGACHSRTRVTLANAWRPGPRSSHTSRSPCRSRSSAAMRIGKKATADSTLTASRAVPHPSTAASACMRICVGACVCARACVRIRTRCASQSRGDAQAMVPPILAKDAETRDRTGDLQIFSLTLSQLSYRGSTLHRPSRFISTVRLGIDLSRFSPY